MTDKIRDLTAMLGSIRDAKQRLAELDCRLEAAKPKPKPKKEEE